MLLLVTFLWNCNSPVETTSAPEVINTQIFREIMDSSATAWNAGSLVGHLSIYDSAATFMGANGLIGIPALKENFQKKYFNGAKPVQQLAFDQIQVKPLGTDFALVTGKFILSGGDQPERSGRFSLVFGKTKAGWKVLHDHSS
jgi:ketosteroid isomerase-like protein